MKNLLFLIFFLPNLAWAQFTDDFSDGNFTTNPVWSGETDSFEVDASNRLHLLASGNASDTSYLSTPSQAIENAVWEFYFQLDVNPSGTNYAKVYLVSDREDMEGSVRGYFVKLGGTADEVSLFRQDGNSETEIINGKDKRLDYAPVRVWVRVTRDAAGNWELFADSTGVGSNYISEGTTFDDAYKQSFYFGVFCKYTSTRFDKFYFDDFTVTGDPFTDNEPPAVSAVNVVSATELDIYFSENLQPAAAETEGNYFVNNGIGAPSSAVLDGADASLVHLTFSAAFPNGQTNTLTITGVEDLSGNIIADTSIAFLYAVPAVPGYQEVLINEIFPDPTPAVGLPEEEFVELYNNTDSSFFDLQGWTFTDGSSMAVLPDYLLKPKEHIILASRSDSAAFAPFGTVVAVSSLPSLNNSGDSLVLQDNNGNIIDEVKYSSAWYGDSDKDDGGWTLELIDPASPCTGAANWTASQDEKGGTPGQENSVFGNLNDNTPPDLQQIIIIDSLTIKLIFSEGLDQSTAVALSNYFVNNSIGNPDSLSAGTGEVVLYFSTPFTIGIIYTISVSGVKDCAGNVIGMNNTAEFGIPEEIELQDIVINEVLFNPYSEDVDFVELYNRSGKVLDIGELTIAEADPLDADTVIDEEKIPQRLFLPGEYAVITSDPQKVKARYYTPDPESFIKISAMPNYPDKEGVVWLLKDTQTIDKLHYHESWHFELIDDKNGVSLERINPDAPTQQETNWHSAASTASYATPGSRNSQFYGAVVPTAEVTIDPKVFSPDNDGYKDFVNIRYKLDREGYVGNITIFDAAGREVKRLVQNELLAAEGVYTWDGVNEAGEKARIGAYIIYFEYFNLDGAVAKVKETVVLGGRLRN